MLSHYSLFNCVILQYCTPTCFMDLSYMSVASVHCCSLPHCCLWLRTWNYLQWLSCVETDHFPPADGFALVIIGNRGKKVSHQGDQAYILMSLFLFCRCRLSYPLVSPHPPTPEWLFSHSLTLKATLCLSCVCSISAETPTASAASFSANKWKSLSLNSYVWHKFSILECVEWTDHL